MKLDSETRHHLTTWLIRHVDYDARRSTRDTILANLRREPDLIDRDFSWSQIAAR
jgi:hypothetical protein